MQSALRLLPCHALLLGCTLAQFGTGSAQGNGSLSTKSRLLQETYSFLMTNMQCKTCCTQEWRACDCILNCDIMSGACDGINRPICEKVRECYVQIDNNEPKGYDFEWQCDLMKCIAYCLRHHEVCDVVTSVFREDHCTRSLDFDLTDCDVNCAGAWPTARVSTLLLGVLLVMLPLSGC
mmetsp:Transcript_85861/g.152035  ORF Transcript_85861/g.152035 Transcript_85861/m.152035 type:complete len:179 (-) Transcript_85861:46-582(-)